ncbi:hypothetical protein Tco_0646161 [Tanacetum coccineum]
MKTTNRMKSIAKKSKKTKDVEKETKVLSPTKETTATPENTPTRRTKANAARLLSLQNPKPTQNPPRTPLTNVDTTQQTETTNAQNTSIISPVISNDSTKTPPTTIQETTNETIQQSPVIQLEVLGIPMGKKKLESDSPREYNDEFQKEFKEQFEFKKFITTTDLSKLIQKTTNTDFMFQMNYLMLFANYMINCDNSSILKYFVTKNIKSKDIISDFNWYEFIWNHIRTSKVNWDDSTSENWYYEPNTVLMLIYLHYTKFDSMVTMPRKWPAIKNWTNQEVIDREILEMNAGEFGKVEFIEDDDEGNANETEIEKQKLREFQTVLKEKKELDDLLKENMELDELFNGDEKLALFVERFKKEFNKGMDKDENQAGTSGSVHWDVADTNMTTFEQTETEKKATEEKAANKAKEMRKKDAKNEAAEKEATTKEKEEAEKLADKLKS